MTIPKNPRRIRGIISCFLIGENRLGLTILMNKKIIQAVNRRRMVRLVGVSSRSPSFIKGKAKAQKTIGMTMTKFS